MGRTRREEVEKLSSEFKLSKNRIIKALGVAKSSVYYKSRKYPNRKPSNRKELPLRVKRLIQIIARRKSTYGVPRIRAILRRDHGFNTTKYMVLRFMDEKNLLIKKNRTRGPSRKHDGKISVDKINTRWASDITSIKCWNGEKIRVAVILDCCDRSVISWLAAKHIQACDIEKMVDSALNKRFRDFLPLKGQLQFLTDNRPEFIEKELNKNLKKWNIESCFTPTYSPQSNGMVEAFNGTFKRDYVYESCLDSNEVVHSQISKWISEYNNYAPHSALKMKTPTEYFILKSAA
jgi:putative transposase